ncbi:MAG TPA: nuclear transport factor 2 family protein [Stellaceae bacterium]|nr:nuclear transport factor 2 family protein [Stellaceae bacterium]
MSINRRHLAIAGAATLGVLGLLQSTPAVADDEAALKDAVEALRKAIFAADKAKLDALTAAELSYGHSSAVVQNKSEFIDGVVNRKMTVKSLDFPELKVGISGDSGWTRHRYVSDSEQDGKPNHVDIGVLGVWQKQSGEWKLFARQGYKLS